MDPSSSSSTPGIKFDEVVTQMNARYLAMPEELCPASRPSSPTSAQRVATTKNRIMALVNLAGGDTTNPKWGYVSRTTSLACTSRKYVGIAVGVRMGDGRKVNPGKKFKWELPETEDGWKAYEQRWEAAVAKEAERNIDREKGVSRSSKTSKYWRKPVEEEPEVPSRPSSKADVIREKVARWQAEVATVTIVEDVPEADSVEATGMEKGKGKAQVQSSEAEKIQASLGFPVVKRSSVTSAKKGSSSAPARPRVSPAARVPAPRVNSVVPSATNKNPSLATTSDNSDSMKGAYERSKVALISEVPEHSFFPPSFPSQLQTSTPRMNDRRQKPPPITPCSPPPSSIRSFDPSRSRRFKAQHASSSPPAVSTAFKRVRSPTSTFDDVRMDAISHISPRALAPVKKKARVEPPPHNTEQEAISSGSLPVPPSTPPPTSPPPMAPVTPVSRGKGLGNARGLPVLATPDSHPLPTLTKLLASSRRSKPRPRPPSRKSTPQSNPGAKAKDKFTEQATGLPAVAENAHESEPEASPTKTYFSSPASGSSGSPMSIAHRPRSPISPLFTQHPSMFVPQYTSTPQRPGAIDEDPFLGGSLQPHGGLTRESSGFIGMGYSSQFDVEGHVEQVSELLERDVDFNGWLRDMDTEGDEDHDMAAASQSQSAVGVEN